MKTKLASLYVISSFLPAFAQTTLNLSEDLVRLGIASSNMAPNQSALDAGPLLVAGVNYAQANQINRIVADQGAYYFRSLQQPNYHVNLGAPTGLTIDLQGSDLYFTHTFAYGIVTAGNNLTLQNFTLEYLPLPSTQLQVTSVNPGLRQIQYAVPAGWSDPSVFNSLSGTAGWDGTVEVQIFRNGRPAPGTKRMATNPPFSGSSFNLINYGFQPGPADFANIRPGDTAVLSLRYGLAGLLVTNCTGCTVRNITSYSSPGDGIDVNYSTSTTVERVYTMPRPGTDRLVSTLSSFTLTNPGPNSTTRLNRSIRSMDDGFGFTQWINGLVQSQPGPRTLVVGGTYATTLAQGETIASGTPVEFRRPSDGGLAGNAVIVSQTAIQASPPFQVTFTFDRDLPSGLTGTAMYNADPNRGHIVMERNAVEDQTSCCRGVSIWGLANSSFTGNYIQRAALTAVHVISVFNPLDWQSPPLLNFNIANNILDQPNTTVNAYANLQLGGIDIMGEDSRSFPLALSVNQNISVTGNFIADPGDPAVWMGNTNGGSVSANYFLNPNGNPALISSVAAMFDSQFPGADPLLLQPVVIETSVNVGNTANVVDLSSSRMWVTDMQYRELAAYAPGSVYRLNAYNLGTLPKPAITLTDADGVAWPVSVKTTAAHALDSTLPAAAGLGGAYFTLISGATKYFGTLFLDSQDNIPAVNGCTLELSVASTSVTAPAASIPVLAITQAGCDYQVVAADSFVSVGPTTSGTGVVLLNLATNTGGPRTANFEIGGRQFSISQAGQPAIIQAIVDSWDYTAGLAPGEWVTITGTNLASGAPQTWNLNGTQRLPTSLGGAMVTFNGAAAALLYVSPTQINALVPASVSPGPVQVVVQLNGASSAPFTITATATQPAIYAPPSADGTTFFVTAALQGTGFLVGNSTTDARVVRAARPGDILDLYMIGLGATADPSQFITDQSFSAAYPVSASVNATVGGETAQVLFAGLTSPGLYLVRIAIPSDLAAGPQPIQISAGSAQTRSSLVLMVGAATPNLIQNGSFESALTGNWQTSIDTTSGVVATVQRAASTAEDGSYSAQIDVSTAATASNSASTCLYCAVQFFETGLPIKQGNIYQLQFWAKADTSRTMKLNIIQAAAPYNYEGLATAVPIGGTWQQYVIYFQASATDPNGRVTFYFGDQAGNVWLDKVSLQ